jgi:hypothetical protein
MAGGQKADEPQGGEGKGAMQRQPPTLQRMRFGPEFRLSAQE